MFLEYGDDSVAQLGGVHLACEQSSNLLTKILEWGRLMAYLEQSTRYIPYDARLGGLYRFFRPPSILRSRFGARYVGDLDALFDSYAGCLPRLMDWARERYPKEAGDSDFVYKQTIKAKACDAARGMLPAATLSNVGIYGTGQAFEALLLRMRAHPLPEARAYADLMLSELRKVIPSFLTRVDRPDRGLAWSAYLEETRAATEDVVHRIFGAEVPEPRPGVVLTDFDPEGEDKVLAAISYPHLDLPDDQVLARVKKLGPDERASLLRAYVGDARQPPPPPGPRIRADRLPVRRHARLRRVPRPSTAPHAHDRMAAALAASRVRGARGDAGSRSRDAVRRRDGAERGTARRAADRVPARGSLCGLACVSHALRDADERARGDARPRAPDLVAGSSDLPTRVSGDAPTDSATKQVTARSPTRCRTSTTTSTTSSGSPPNERPTPVGAPTSPRVASPDPDRPAAGRPGKARLGA